MELRHQISAAIVALATSAAFSQVINIPQSTLLPLGDPGMTSWLAQEAGLIGSTDMRLIAEVTGTAVANSMLLDIQNDGFPGVDGTTNDFVVFQASDIPGAVATVDIPPDCSVAIFHDVYDENGEFLAGPDGILNVNSEPGTSDAYLCSNTQHNYTGEGRRQLIKYFLVSPAHSYQFTSQWGTVTQLGSGYRAFLFFDDDHSPNYDYDDIIVGVIALPCANDDNCVDSDLCNGAETCVEGFCLAGTQVICDDGSFCNGVEVCHEGICEPGTPPTCDDAVACTLDSCAENACMHIPNDDLCSTNELFCDGIESCDALLGCVSSGDPCAVGEICDEENDRCRNCQTDADCDDFSPCTVGEACIEGACIAGVLVDCSQNGDQCNLSSCDPLGEEGNCDRVEPVENGGSCDDDQFCTEGEVCQSGACAGGSSRDCSHLNDQCNAGVCDEETDACLSQPFDDGTACNDGDGCTTGDACLSGTCQGEVLYGLAQWAALTTCLESPDNGISESCACFDVNEDLRIDLEDVVNFLRRFDGR